MGPLHIFIVAKPACRSEELYALFYTTCAGLCGIFPFQSLRLPCGKKKHVFRILWGCDFARQPRVSDWKALKKGEWTILQEGDAIGAPRPASSSFCWVSDRGGKQSQAEAE